MAESASNRWRNASRWWAREICCFMVVRTRKNWLKMGSMTVSIPQDGSPLWVLFSVLTLPYAAEGPTIARLHAFIREQGYAFDGSRQKHHEIYLSDPRRAAPEKMRTVIRQPMTRTS